MLCSCWCCCCCLRLGRDKASSEHFGFHYSKLLPGAYLFIVIVLKDLNANEMVEIASNSTHNSITKDSWGRMGDWKSRVKVLNAPSNCSQAEPDSSGFLPRSIAELEVEIGKCVCELHSPAERGVRQEKVKAREGESAEMRARGF